MDGRKSGTNCGKLSRRSRADDDYLLILCESEVGHSGEVALGGGEQHAVSVGGAVAQRAVVAAHQRQVGQHARLPVVGQVPRARRELLQRHRAPRLAGVTRRYLCRCTRTHKACSHQFYDQKLGIPIFP